MRITKLLKIAAVAAGIAFGTTGYGAGGDIYEIRPCTSSGEEREAWATKDSPLAAGVDAYFLIRLQKRDVTKSAWYVDYNGVGSREIYELLYPMQVGVYISGKLKYATLTDIRECAANSSYTDLIFKYHTEVGDFALPAIIAVDNSGSPAPADNSDDANAYFLNPNRYGPNNWVIRNTDGETCNFWFGEYNPLLGARPSTVRMSDYDLSQTGIYIQTVDFDSAWETPRTETEAGIWRTVHQDSTIASGAVRLEAAAALTDAVTVHVWSDNEDAVRISGGHKVTMMIGYDTDGVTKVYKDFQVADVKITGGQIYGAFSIFGVAEGGEANLILSPWESYRFPDGTSRADDYITVPVKCIEPMPTTIRIERDDATVVAPTAADDKYLTAVTRLTISATQAPKANVKVTVKTQFQVDPDKTDWYNYVRFSLDDSVDTLPGTDEPEVTLTPTDYKKYVYVYALRSESAFTIGTGRQVQFMPEVLEDELVAAEISRVEGTGIYINADKPVITAPIGGDDPIYSVTAGEKLEIPVAVNDTYADMTDTTTGYKVRIKASGSSTAVTMPVTYTASGEGGLLESMDADKASPSVTYPSTPGEVTTTVEVFSPIRKQWSEVSSFKVTVTPARTSAAEVIGESTEFVEGETVRYKVKLSDAPSGNVYAFLYNYEESPDGTFGGTGAKAILTNLSAPAPTSKGILITSVATEAQGSFIVLDGISPDEGGSTYTFGVVLCSTQTWDPGSIVPGYPTTDLINISVVNKDPTFLQLYLNGFESDGDGYEFPNEYPKGQVQTIQPEFDDVSYDLAHGFIYKWTIRKDGKDITNGIVRHEDASDAYDASSKEEVQKVAPGTSINQGSFTYNFPNAGRYEVRIQMRDKDMSRFSSEDRRFFVNIIDQPQVQITVDDMYLEMASRDKIHVGLGYFPDSGETMVVKLTVTPPAGDNAGVLTLDDEYKRVPDGYGPLAANEYYVQFTAAGMQDVLIEAKDGTMLSSSKGFTITGEVMNETESIEPGVTWKDYYRPYSVKAYIENEAPIFSGVTPENTNEWVVAGGEATAYPIRFTIQKDVDADFAGIASFPGIKVTILGCDDGTIKPALASHPNKMEFYVKTGEDQSYVFTPNFGSKQGQQTITLMIEDKDGGMQSWTYLYKVTSSKMLKTTASGPAGGVGTGLSRRYAQAKGRGQGHVFVGGYTSPDSGSMFTFVWNCQKSLNAVLYGIGYKVGAVDNGSLNYGGKADPFDFPVSSVGGIATGSDTKYSYPDATRDSYLYTWLVHTFGENGGVTSEPLSDTAVPEIAGDAPAPTPIALPTDSTEDGGYQDTWAEAIFSKEKYEFDNCGDINQDGIPDRTFIDYPDLGVTFDGSSDLADASGLNNDNDFLPALSSSGNRLVPSVSSEWQTKGGPFNAYLEVRGFGQGLNAGYPNRDGSNPDPDYTVNEKRAYLLWAEKDTEDNLKDMSEQDVNNLFKEEANLTAARAALAAWNANPLSANPAGWSPERPTDPTVSDTDEDGLDDGYEYWFWYGAKVGYYDKAPESDGKWQGTMKGRRLNLDDIENYDEIPSSEICSAFDPLVSAVTGDSDATRGNIAERDFDNDGLFDVEEYLIGSNPVDCDTDDDCVADGIELVWGLNPLVDERQPSVNRHNLDGDVMAHASLDEYNVACIDDTQGGGTVKKWYLVKSFEDGIIVGALMGEGEEATLEDVTRKVGEDTIPCKSYDEFLNNFKELEKIDTAELDGHYTIEPATGLSLIHDQVYRFLGFDPRTGWSGGCGHGYVTKRWCPTCNPEDAQAAKVGDAGYVVNTRAYYMRDEYLFAKYRGFRDGDTVLEKLTRGCTVAGVPFESKTYGEYQTVFSSTVHGADTDENGVPDGWEAYVGYDPRVNPGGNDNIVDEDDDKLSLVSEYTSLDGAKVYGECEKVKENTTSKSGWFNKFFPTDPENDDTDGDGITDSKEGKEWNDVYYAGRLKWSPAVFNFIYGSPEDDDKTVCFRGGGTNPCSFDTDLDGLPDAWEREFAGIVVDASGKAVSDKNDDDMYTDQLKAADGFGSEKFEPKGPYIVGGMDATDSGDAYTNPQQRDKWTGTFRDRDFDRDGLENFQEYLVQSVRCWRYDDTLTPLMGRILRWPSSYGDPELVESDGEYLVHDILSGKNMLELVKNSTFASAGYGSDDYASVAKEYDYEKLGYMAPCSHDWDQGAFYGKKLSLTYGDNLGLRYMRRPSTPTGYNDSTGEMSWTSSIAYVSTDPRRWDSDLDGMDDFWEIFHGLNPILGEDDVISVAYTENITASNNKWTEVTGIDGYDPVGAPWLMGLPDADPDGDGIRNSDESVSGNMTSPTTYHTDPTPLWMTEPTTPASYVAQYYSTTQSDSDTNSDLRKYPWAWWLSVNGAGEAASTSYKFSVERTEGYDTDGDWTSDGREVVRDTSPITDPLNANDPDRRAALYLPGEDACAYSAMEGNIPVYSSYDMFRQFTVEAWVKPERIDRAQTIVERGFAYPMSNLVNDEETWRANFRLEIDASGVARGVFDNDNAVASGVDGFSTQTLAGGKVDPNVWTHLAMSYDGSNVCMYVNGQLRATAKSRLIPANGVKSILQEPASTNKYPLASYATVSGANIVGARRAVAKFDWDLGFEQFTDFFQGYVAEVRFWDGARSANEIASAFTTRMTTKDAAANREEVYLKWKGTDDEPGGTRNDTDGRTALPAQLITVYNFQQLPAAGSAEDVSTMPSGFEHSVQDNTTLSSDDIKVGWWEKTPLKSTVYTDTRIVPYAQNLVSHLPLLDGAFEDTMFWSGKWAGYTSVAENGVKTYAIPDGGNPYKGRCFMMERSYRLWRYDHLMEVRESVEDEVKDLYKRSTFQNRSEVTGLDDLVPLGGAYAKLDTGYWDGFGSSTVWSDTGTDADGDGLPDWWESIYGDVSPYTTVERDGIEMPAWEAYMRDLAAGMQPDGGTHGEYVSTADADGDGLVDWWQNLYGIKSGANADDDGDGLANYVEYLLSEIFKIGRFDPTLAYSVQKHASDYFYRVGQSYVGEIFTDHDRIDDVWEDKFGNSFASRYLYDASRDNDGDGWTNYSEFQAGTDPSKLGSLGVDAVQMTEYPVPVVETKITYEGTQNTAGKSFVVKAWRDPEMATVPDAVWTIGGEGSTEVYDSGVSNTVSGTKYIGMNPGRQMMMHLSPGSIVAGSVEFEIKDQNWTLYDSRSGQAYATSPATAIWKTIVIDKQRRSEQDKGDIIYQINDKVIGEIDYVTGTVTIDFSLLPEYMAIVGDISSPNAGGNYLSVYEIYSSYVRVKWNAQPVVGGSSVTYYLGDPDTPGENNNSLGHLKEGRNTFVAFCDLDGDGKYSAGEPYGVVPSVDVGWNYAKVNVELTDTTPVTARFSIGGNGNSLSAVGASTDQSASEAPNDRTALWGSASGNFPIETITVGQSTGGVFQRVRVVRTAINGSPCSLYGVSDSKVVLEKVINVNNDSYITEADFLKDGSFDIDWTLADELSAAGVSASTVITNVSYRVVIGDGSVDGSATNNLLGIVYNRWFDTPAVQSEAKPIALAPGIVTASAPTFKWSIPDNLNSYTAFQIQVLDGSTVVWSSGMQHMPPRVRDADYGWRYEWTAPLFADSRTPDGSKLFENNKAYKWRVAVHNARYKNVTRWSTSGDFRMEVQTESQNFGSAQVAVRYFGPDVVATSGKIRVQAFATPDFSGSPVGEGCVEDVSAIADGSSVLTANARIIGLEPGTYYIRAFIDTSADGKLASWESWGFACDRDVAGAAMYTPSAVKVGPKSGMSLVIPVFIEDCDTDQDNLPDAWEIAQKGSLGSLGTGDLDQGLRGGVAVKSELTGALNGEGSLTTGLSVMLSSALKSPYVAAMVFGVDVSGATSATDAQKKVDQAVGTAEQSGEPKKVAFNAITLDQAAGTVTLDIETVVDSATTADSALSAIYEIPASGTLEVTLKLWKKGLLSDAAWTVVAEKPVSVGTGDERITLSFDKDVDLSSGFFKVSLEK